MFQLSTNELIRHQSPIGWSAKTRLLQLVVSYVHSMHLTKLSHIAPLSPPNLHSYKMTARLVTCIDPNFTNCNMPNMSILPK